MYYKVMWCLGSFYKDVISFEEKSSNLGRLISYVVLVLEILLGWEPPFVLNFLLLFVSKQHLLIYIKFIFC
jgi:hypothetical protein